MSPSKQLKKGKDITIKAAEKAVKEAIGADKKSSKTKSRNKKKDDTVDDLIKLAAATIGIVSEIAHHRKEKKRLRKEKGEDEEMQPSTGAEDPAESSQIPQGDSPQDQSTPSLCPRRSSLDIYKSRNKTRADEKEKKPDLTAVFLSRLPHPPCQDLAQPLQLPVLIPQRRPNTRARGFLRAYPPSLSARSISQTTFLDFIDTLNAVLVPNPWLYTINLVGEVGSAAPDPITMIAIGVGVGVVAEGCLEANSRMKGNEFLERTNRELWAPRGLVCSVVKVAADEEEEITCGSDDDIRSVNEKERESISIAGTVKNVVRKPESYKDEARVLQQHLQASLVAWNGTVASREFAPLVFPDPQEAESNYIAEYRSKDENDIGAKKPNAFKRADRWMDEYMDKRAQGHWVQEHEHRDMAQMVPKPEFRSRYADPSHPACSGDALALVTGGKWSMSRSPEHDADKETNSAEDELKDNKLSNDTEADSRAMKDEEKRIKKEEEKAKARSKKADKERLKSKSISGTLGGLLKNDILYLMIVDKSTT